jgi:hypothetical protein
MPKITAFNFVENHSHSSMVPRGYGQSTRLEIRNTSIPCSENVFSKYSDSYRPSAVRYEIKILGLVVELISGFVRSTGHAALSPLE